MYGEALSTVQELYERSGIDLLARLVYAEAKNNSDSKKRGIAFVVENRRMENSEEFGGNTLEGVILKPTEFAKISSADALQPDTTSSEWANSLDIAVNLSGKVNPVGNCVYYTTTALYSRRIFTENGEEYWAVTDMESKKVLEKAVIDNYTFYRLEE